MTRRYLVRGRVQGVGFRYFVQRLAREMGMTGWVRNLPSGEVEVLAFGGESQQVTFSERLRSGHPFAKVTNVDITEIFDEKNCATDFEITY